MPLDSHRIPTYRLHKSTGQAVVRLQGRDIYLGKHDTESSGPVYSTPGATFPPANPQ